MIKLTKCEQRTNKDMIDVHTSRTTKDGFVRTNRTTDALRPLVDAIRQLEQSTDRYLAAREAQEAAEREDARDYALREFRQCLTGAVPARLLDDPHGVQIAKLEARLFRKDGRYESNAHTNEVPDRD